MAINEYTSAEENLINRCSQRLTATTISDSLPERLNSFAFKPFEDRATSFVAVSSVDQKMAMEKTGPYWHAYLIAFPDLRFVGATARLGHGLVTLDESIRHGRDLAGKRIGLITQPSSLRALQEVLLIKAWDIYDRVIVKDYVPADMLAALAAGDVDAVFMPVSRMVGGKMVPLNPGITRENLHWIDIAAEDVTAATENSPVIAEQVAFVPGGSSTGKDGQVGLITFDAAWFTFASASDDVVYEFISMTQQVCSARYQEDDCKGRTIESLLTWPQLNPDLVHPGALRFYAEHGVEIQ